MLDNEDIVAAVSAALETATNGIGNEMPGMEESLDYYLGNPNGKEVDGRSQVTSTDVADAIEWIMPQVMKSFTQNNEIVVFDPVHQGDEKQAEIESEYVYDVLMKQNNGFILIHQFVKDALLQRNGMLKVFYEDNIEEWTSDYTGITEQELNVLGSASDAEIVQMTDYQDPMMGTLYDVKVKFTSQNGRVKVIGVPPEEFRINADHNSIDVSSASFTAHVVEKTYSELVQEGIAQSVLDELPASDGSSEDNKAYRFTAQDEEDTDTGTRGSIDRSQELFEISECYMYIDHEDTGIAELTKVTLAGGDSPTTLLSSEKIESSPWIATTAIIMSHKFQGLSLFDRLKDIQDQKTALWRSMFDNIYFQNNQRYAVVENQVNLDDLLVSRPFGIVRTKRLDAISPLPTPQLSTDSFGMMGYLDEVKAGRSGVSAEGGATPQNIGDRVGSQGVDRMMNAKEALVGLIIRVIAETGIKPLCVKIRDLSSKHSDSITDYKFRGEWIKIQPSSWINRSSCTVRVGTGTGDVTEKLTALNFVSQVQEKLQAMPEQSMVKEQEIYTTMDQYCKMSGLNGANGYFVDPSSEEGKRRAEEQAKATAETKQKEDEMQAQMIKAQTDIANAEMQKAQSQQEGVQLKAQADMAKNQLQLQKQTHDAEIKLLEQQLKEANLVSSSIEKNDELKFKYDDMVNRHAIEMSRIEAEKDKEINDNVDDNKETIEGE